MPFQEGHKYGQGRPKKNVTAFLEGQRLTIDELREAGEWVLAQSMPKPDLGRFRTWDEVPDEADRFGKMGQYGYGFPTVDKHTLGFDPGDYVIVGAPTGQGKTQFATYLANHNATAGKRVLFLSREERAEGIKGRLARTSTSKQFDNIRFPVTDSLGIENVLEIIARFADTGGHIVVVDYIQAFCRGSHATDKLTQFSEDLRDLARLRKIVIVALAQVNRSGYKAEDGPELEHLYNSSTLEHDSCSILLLWRVGYKLFVKLGKTRKFDLATAGGQTVLLRAANGQITDDYPIEVQLAARKGQE